MPPLPAGVVGFLLDRPLGVRGSWRTCGPPLPCWENTQAQERSVLRGEGEEDRLSGSS